MGNSPCFGTEMATGFLLNEEFNFSSPECGFGVNATNGTKVTFDFGGAPISEEGGQFHLFYQKRVIDASTWVEEPVNDSVVEFGSASNRALSSPSIFLSMVCVLLAALRPREDDLYCTNYDSALKW